MLRTLWRFVAVTSTAILLATTLEAGVATAYAAEPKPDGESAKAAAIDTLRTERQASGSLAAVRVKRRSGESPEDFIKRANQPVASLADQIRQVRAESRLFDEQVSAPPTPGPHAKGSQAGTSMATNNYPGEDWIWPEECRARYDEHEPPSGWYYRNHHSACQVEKVTIRHIEIYTNPPGAAVIGESEVRMTSIGKAHHNGRIVDWDVFVDQYRVKWGRENLVSPVTVFVSCQAQTSDGGACSTGSTGLTMPLASWKVPVHYMQRIQGTTPGATGWASKPYSRNNPDPKVSMYLMTPVMSTLGSHDIPGGSTNLPPTVARCDNAHYIVSSPNGGCSFPNTPGIIWYDYNNPHTTESVHFFYLAYWYLDKVKRNSIGLYIPGSHQKEPRTTMTRNYYEKKTRYRVRQECTRKAGGSYTRAPDGSARECDEIPFHSTYQAAPFDTIGSAATWAAMPVKAEHNSATGNMLGEFYDFDRILHEDPFFVHIRNAPEECEACEDMPSLNEPDVPPNFPLPEDDGGENEPDSAPLTPPQNTYGDPHMVSLDGLHFEMQSVGEFDFAASSKYGFKIQTRFVAGGSSWSAVDRAAVTVNGHVVEFTRTGGMLLDRVPYNLPNGNMVDLGNYTAVLRVNGTYFVTWDGPVDGPVLSFAPGASARMGLRVPDDHHMTGLVGNNDGSVHNDLKLRDGTQLPYDASLSTLHGAYADSWRVTDATSLFTYGPGQNTATFTNLGFPAQIVTIHTLSPSEIASGSRVCADHQVPPGPQFDACVVDIVLTSNNEFAEMAAQRKEPAVDPNAATVNSAGDVAVTFETEPVPRNFAPAFLTEDTATTTFAGPFSGRDAYRMYVASLPPHLQGTLAFDLITLGNWRGDADTEQISLKLDTTDNFWTQQFTSSLTPLRSGILANGQPFEVYRISMPLTHHRGQLDAVFSATGFDGLASQGFGIDNVAIHVDPVPPQVFTTTVPFTAEPGVPATGAGNLETAVSGDEYRFTTTAAQALFVDVLQCLPGSKLAWRIVRDSDGTGLADGVCGSEKTAVLPAGAYRLVVAGANQAGTYRLSVFPVPAPQVFDVTLPVSVSDGVPAAGAGRLETKASQDEYRFTAIEGQNLYLRMRSCPNGSISLTWKVVDPAGLTKSSGYCTDTQINGLQAGAHRLVVTARGESSGPYALDLLTIPGDATATVTLGGAAATVTTTVPGQRAAVSFTGTAGQRASVKFSSGTISVSASVVNPDGTELKSSTYVGSSGFFEPLTLPADGTYRVVIDPSGAHVGSMTVQAYAVPADVAVNATVGGAAVTATVGTPGQNAVVSFAGTAGRKVAVKLSGGTFTSYVSVKKPDGTDLRASSYTSSSDFIDPLALPATGTYQVLINPTSSSTGSLTVQLYDVPAEATATAIVGGSAVTAAVATPGQNAVVSFAGTAGQQVSVAFTSATMSPYATIKKPDGTDLKARWSVGSSDFVDPMTLPANGTYQILLDPSGSTVGSATVQVFAGMPAVTASAALNGPAVTLATTTPGQNASVTFTGTANQLVSVRFTNATMSPHATIKNPDGTDLKARWSVGSSDFVEPLRLPATGSYQILLDPSGSTVGSATVQLWEVPADATATLSLGGAAGTVTTTVPGQNAAILFTATAGQRASVVFSNGTSSPYATIYNPDGSVLKARSYIGNSGFFEPMTLPASGLYRIALDPGTYTVGAITVSLHTVPADASLTATVGGDAVTVTTAVPGQNGVVSFSGAAGQQASFAFSQGTISPYATIKNPDGSILKASFYVGSSMFVEPLTLPATGTYQVLVDPAGSSTGSIALQVFPGTAVVTADATVGGPQVTVTTTTPGQNGQVTFTGTAGQRVSLRLAGTSVNFYAAVKNPDGTDLKPSWYVNSPTFVDTMTLPADGVYRILLDPNGSAVGSMTAQIYAVPADAAGSVAIDGAASTVTTTVPGQNAVLTFTGTAGQRVSFRFSNATMSPSGTIKNPDGTDLKARWSIGTASFVEPLALPATGTYQILLDPSSANVGAVTAQLYTVPSDVTATASVDGPAVTVPVAVPGQNAVLTFGGTAGQRVSVKFTNGTMSPYATIKNPDGTDLKARWSVGSGDFVEPLALPATGTYQILLDPSSANVGAVTVQLYAVPADVAGTVAVDGGAVTVANTVPGQNAVLTFSGTGGQRVSFRFTATNSPYATIKKPDGTDLKARWSVGSSDFLDPITLPATGTYQILVDPGSSNVGNTTVQLYAVPADVTGTIATDGVATTIAVAVPGQNAVLTFTGTAGQRITLRTTATMAPYGTIVKPDGTALKARWNIGSSDFVDALLIPVSGTYQILLDPSSGNVGSATLQLHSVPADATAVATIGGPAATVTTTVPGQNAVVTVAGNAGQTVSVTISASVLNAYVTILNPDGTVLKPRFYVSSTTTVSGLVLPATGIYQIQLDPSSTNIGTGSVQVT